MTGKTVKHIRTIMKVAGFALALSGVFLCPAQAKKISEVKIGNILPLTGPSAQGGIQAQKACELATEYINAAGGIKSLGGARLTNVWADSRGETSFGVTAAEQLIKTDKVHIVSGAWNSAVTHPTTQTAERAHIPYVVPVSVRDAITERGLKYTFRIPAKDSWRARDQFRFLEDLCKATDTKVKTLAFVYENGGWGKAMRDQWKKLAANSSYKVVLDAPYASTEGDLTLVAMKIKNARPDAVLMASFTQDAVLLAHAMAQVKVSTKAVIASGAGHATRAFLKNAGKDCEYLFDIAEWEPDINRPSIAAVNTDFRKRCGSDLTAETVNAFASVYVIADALERAESVDPEDIRDALADTELCRGKGVLGIDILPYDCIEFDRTGQNRHAGFVMVQFREVKGVMERVTVWPSSTARPGYKAVFPLP
jgi:branched-chain amino acid transport system substrate-binding protein